MQFKNLKSKDGLKEFDKWLQCRSYIEGFCPSEADLSVFEQLQNAPVKEFCHALRWYTHIQSFSAEEKVHMFGKACSSSAGDAATNGTAADDDFDLFADDDEEDAEKEAVKQQRLKAYEEKKAKKPAVVAKSSIILDVKPWDDECDLKEMEKKVREIECDGLLWSKQAKILPVAFGIKKLQIGCVVEDDKVSTDFLEESITAIEDLVQSVDIVAFNKI